MSTRLPPVDEHDPEVASVFEEIRSSRGFVSNALRSLAHSPGVLRHFARVGEYVKYRSDLTERVRELTILCAARGVPYEWEHHRPLALQAGIPEAAIEDIGMGRDPASLSPPERAVARFVAELMGSETAGDATMVELQRHWSPRQITDMAMTATYYRALGVMASAFRVEIEAPEVLQVERDWQKGR